MTIAGKINALIIILAIAAGSLLSVFLISGEYADRSEQIRARTSVAVDSQPQLQIDVYYNDKESLQAAVDGLLSEPAIQYALVRNANGTILIEVNQTNLERYQLLDFKQIRKGSSPLEQGDFTHSVDAEQSAYPILAVLSGGEKIIDQTIPIFSLINPLEQNHTRDDFGAALGSPERVESRYVIGYVQVGISRSALLASLLPYATTVLSVVLLFIILCAVIANIVTRRITAPLSRLAGAAYKTASGEIDQPLKIEGSGEIRQITTILHDLFNEVNSRKTKMNVDHQLLSMKVDERTLQLSRRNQELNTAVKQVTETKDRLRQLAYFDSLTSLPNRRLFTEQLSLLLRLASRNRQTLALLFLDLDNFKRINDSLGHSAGDLLLREVGIRLSSCIRESDVLAHYVDSDGSRIDVSRLGGDEFTVVLNQIETAESAAIVAQRILDVLAAPMIIEGHELVVTPSIGIAIAPRDAGDVEGLLKAADTAMYYAKSSGKNSYLYYNSDMDAAGVDRLLLETDLRKAIERNELVLHYQPQVDTETGTVIGAEALVRWEHPKQGLIPPFKFIPLAEEMGLIGELGKWVLEDACRQMVEFIEQGFALPKVAVNVSALQFNNVFITQVEDVLHKTGLDPACLELEVTEGLMMDNSNATIEALGNLKTLGVSLSIDDFGTGYSSLSYLSRFPLDELKIDRSFVIDFDKSDNDASLVIAIIAMAKSMNLKLVAEGVETHEQYHFLTENGAHVIQGYLFSKPVTAEQLQPLLTPYRFLDQIQMIKQSQS
jgi:diguanylate cyclase (GGDEF)-like protein